MSTKIPVTDLLTDAFTFGWGEILTVSKALLLPLIVMTIGIIALVFGLFDFEYLMALDDDFSSFSDFADMFRMSIPLTILVFIAGATFLSLPFYGGYASLFRYIGLGEDPGGWFRLRLDGPMWRTFFAFLIFSIITMLIYAFAVSLAFAFNPGVADAFNNLEMIEDDPAVALPLLGFIFQVFIFALVPLMFVGGKLAPFPAASACENRLMLINSWTKTKGHYWTILGAYILLIIALTLANVAFQLATGVITSLGELLANMGGGLALIGVVMALLLMVVSLVYQLFIMGVQIGFQGTLYKRLWDG